MIGLKGFTAWVQKIVFEVVTQPLHGRHLYWGRQLRIFCDGGTPKWYWRPRLRRLYFDPHWGLNGIAVYLWGREINMVAGVDRRNLYREGNKKHGIRNS